MDITDEEINEIFLADVMNNIPPVWLKRLRELKLTEAEIFSILRESGRTQEAFMAMDAEDIRSLYLGQGTKKLLLQLVKELQSEDGAEILEEESREVGANNGFTATVPQTETQPSSPIASIRSNNFVLTGIADQGNQSLKSFFQDPVIPIFKGGDDPHEWVNQAERLFDLEPIDD